jgi:hypothetical protein
MHRRAVKAPFKMPLNSVASAGGFLPLWPTSLIPRCNIDPASGSLSPVASGDGQVRGHRVVFNGSCSSHLPGAEPVASQTPASSWSSA